ncbi:hypothetical protein [Labilibaculum sp.]|uniref:hypothetical protein n=1 Tax=Labilibaculum sp. TaxID=2060723 RepID=UPI0035679B5C
MSVLLVIVCLALLTSIMVMHVYNELHLSKRIIRAASLIQKLMDQEGIKHLDLEKKFEMSTISTQLRLLEYYLHTLDSTYKYFGSKGTVSQRILNIENVLKTYSYQNDLSFSEYH